MYEREREVPPNVDVVGRCDLAPADLVKRVGQDDKVFRYEDPLMIFDGTKENGYSAVQVGYEPDDGPVYRTLVEKLTLGEQITRVGTAETTTLLAVLDWHRRWFGETS